MRDFRGRRRAGTAVVAVAMGTALGALGGGSAAGAVECPTPPASQSRPWLDPSYTADCRAPFVVAALPSAEQKITALTDRNATFSAMGITVGGLQDGPQGDVRGNGASQFPAQVVVGAAWSRTLAERYGDAIGEEFRARNKTGVLAPDGDIVRTWRWGRQSENYGEDPYHQSELIGPEVRGI